ncbi:hypothetical protein Taro_007256 [Colocasia esculenta]|uniref:Uncharacterized protein n=1 Tax=Colocasia esculenta TaxID=4460 RepID=A0A843TZX7_COLES|nr:hypothetical protein [Colocasia esculenta]
MITEAKYGHQHEVNRIFLLKREEGQARTGDFLAPEQKQTSDSSKFPQRSLPERAQFARMAMMLDAFATFFVNWLGELIEEEVRMQLGVEEDLRTLKSRVDGLQAFLRDAERRNIGDDSVRRWLSRLRDVMYDCDDLADDYNLEVERRKGQEQGSSPLPGSCASSLRRCRCLPSCFSCFPFRHEIGMRIWKVNAELEAISKEKPELLLPETSTSGNDAQPWGGRLDRETSSQFHEDDVVGIDLEAKELVDRLTRGGGDNCHIYAVLGMGGIGKTTLAKKVYHDGRIQSDFQLKLWVCVSQGVTPTKLLKATMEAAHQTCGEVETLELLTSKVSKLVENKRFLLVLDDVWEGKIWEECLRCPLQSGAVNNRVLITTRNEEVARAMRSKFSHNMKPLPSDEGWRMLCKAFEEDKLTRVQKLRPIGMEIVEKCKGLPLAIKAIRGVLARKDPSEGIWRSVLESQLWKLSDKELPQEVMPALYLSYEDLPSHLKRCFIYCSLFPEDFKFHKPNLVQMWVAEGFVKPEERAIDVADDYYRELVNRNLLQTVPDYFEDWGCKMHDVVRELALHVSKYKYIYRGTNNPDEAAGSIRHLTIVGKGDPTVPEIYKKNKCLRTVLLSKNPSVTLSDDFFNTLRRLRVLDLSYTGIDTLSASIGNLIHLRFLNVSFTKLRDLPEDIQFLRSLQTLRATGCKFLHRLPNGVARLLNLTHLTVADTQLDQMPPGIGKVEKLHSLYGFVASDDNLRELKDLAVLRRVTMYKLEAVSGKAQAESAVLGNKSCLEFLRLSCSRGPRGGQWEDLQIQNIEDVFEGLQPPPKLKSLHIDGFFGGHFPSWITRPSLGDLKWLRLEDCELCEELPPLGQFNELRVLHLRSLASVSTVGSQFFGGSTAFPLLEELYFRDLPKWTEWSGLGRGSLPVLKKLHVVKCPKLKSLPEGLRRATSLRELVIEGAKKLKVIKNLPSISELKVSNNRKLEVITNLAELKVLAISNCPSVRETNGLDALGHLRLSAENMDILPSWLAQITSLQRLDLTCSVELLRRCANDGEDWHVISRLPRVEARSHDGSKFVSYVKSPEGLYIWSFVAGCSAPWALDTLVHLPFRYAHA